MSRRLTQPLFTIYDRKTDPMEHVSHYIQMMSLYSHNDGLMCKVFPLSLGPIAMRRFNGLRKGSIRSFSELIQSFKEQLVTSSKVPQPIRSLLSMWMKSGEILRAYTNRY